MKYRLVSLLLISLLIISADSFAQKRAFTIADLYKVKNVGAPVLSPDGEMIAFTVTDYKLEEGKSNTEIYVMKKNGSDLQNITNNEKADYNPIWMSSGKIMFVSSRDGAPQVFTYTLEDNETEKITDYYSGIDAPVLSPNGKLIAFDADVYPECGADQDCNKKISESAEKGPIQAYVADDLLFRHWTSYQAEKYSHIIIYNIDEKTYTDVTPGKWVSPTFMLGGGIGYNFSPDSKELCFVSNHDPHPEAQTNADLWTVSVKGGDAVNITKDNKGWDGWPIYSPDGKYIAYRTQKTPAYESDKFRIALYDRENKTSKIITENFDNWIDDFNWAKNSKTIYFAAENQGYSTIYKLDVSSEKIDELTGEQAVLGYDVSPDQNTLYYMARTTGKPGEIYSLKIGEENYKKITSFNNDLLDEVDFRPAEKMWVEGADGKKVEIFIVKPHNFDPNKKYPLILNVHGGPQGQWMDSFRGDWQVYPGAGYVVAFPNPHGSTGYGQAYTAEISGDWGGKFLKI